MADFLSKEERSKLMSKIRSRDTKIELHMAKLLDQHGIPYERCRADLPGKPDFVIGKLVVFMDGDFWHGRHFEKWSHKLKPFWLNKIANNKRRDRRVDSRLRRLGYRIMHVWETDIWKHGERCLKRIGDEYGRRN
jgi:DNA mismatch endonuclease (patch repair protein)